MNKAKLSHDLNLFKTFSYMCCVSPFKSAVLCVTDGSGICLTFVISQLSIEGR